jgi:hypothetical protein
VKGALRGHYDQIKMILHQDMTIHFISTWRYTWVDQAYQEAVRAMNI